MTASAAQHRLHELGPGLVAAASFGVSDVLCKVVFAAGADVLTLALARGVVGLLFIYAWLRMGPTPRPHSPRERGIALGLGVLFAGVIFGLFEAIARIPVPIAILTYFVYPLLTGIAAALLGLERVGWRGGAAATVAFLGLALTIGAHPQSIALIGIAFALGAACLRTAILLIARASLLTADARLTTWHSLVSSTAIFLLAALLTLNWQPPQTGIGWIALLGVSIGTAVATLALFVSTSRIGPFRTALIMNLEPLLATILSAPLLGEVITPLQATGGAIMLAALVAFQLRR